jgi:predicted transcriptional regulator
MTPASAHASNKAAQEAGWFASNWNHMGASAEVRSQISERMKNQRKRDKIKTMLTRHHSLTTCQIRARLTLKKQTVHATLHQMQQEGILQHEKRMIAGRTHCVWWLA